jgi:hypothetical protein
MGDPSQLEVVRADLHRTRLVEAPVPTLGEGEVLLAVDAFGLTANNVTYAAFGDMLGYWKFFPAEGEWGRIPVWGFADVVASEDDRLAVGARVYGYLPMGTHLVVAPARVGAHDFVDGSAHRADLPRTYNTYQVVSADPSFDADREDERMLLWPLFVTSFLIDDFLDDNDFFGATTVVLSSASSKTAIGTAHRLSFRENVTCVGLTSPARVEFVESLDCYDRVVAYDAVSDLVVEPAVYVDIAGDGAVRASVHGHFGDDLLFSSMVGGTHWDQPPGPEASGPAPAFFFAPDQIVKRHRDWGGDEFDRRVSEAWTSFLDRADHWFRVERRRGPDETADTYLAVLDGDTDPSVGLICSMT